MYFANMPSNRKDFVASICLLALFAHLQAQMKLEPSTEITASWGASYKGTFQSTALNESRKFRLFVPKGYGDTQKKYPLLFVTDGEYNFEKTVVAARELYTIGHMPESIVVAVENPNRTEDMTPPGMGKDLAGGDENGQKFMTFLAKELRPALADKFRVCKPNVLIGHSHGGILGHYAAADWRSDFPFILSLDGPLHLSNKWLVKELNQSLDKGGYLRLVSLESTYGWTDKDWAELKAKAPKDWTLSRAKLTGESHETLFFNGCYLGLKELFRDYSVVSVKDMSGKEVFQHYEEISKLYGERCVPPAQVQRQELMELSIAGQGKEAHQALDELSTSYGKPKDYDEQVKTIDEAAKMMQGKPSVFELVSRPKPGPDEMRTYLGTWEGENGPAEEGTPTTLKFQVVEGKVTGQMIYHLDGQDLTMEITYLKVKPDGLDFGVMNGMFPKGLLVHAGKFAEGKLTGKVEMQGIYFKRPAGLPAPPTILFSFKKVA